MKNNIILFAAITLAGCSTNKTLVKQSDVCITNQSETQVWFLNCERSATVARAWRDGMYGPALVQVVDSTEWAQLEKRAIAKR
jgi:hypothetical protein